MEGLFARFLNGDCTEQEVQHLMEAIGDGPGQEVFRQLVRQKLEEDAGPADHSGNLEAMYREIEQRIRSRGYRRPDYRLWQKIAVAASIIFLLGIAAFWIWGPAARVSPAVAKNKRNTIATDFAPGGQKALLTLSDGRTIILDRAANGTLSREGASKIIKLDDGRLAYTAAGGGQTQTGYNTVATPRGGTYEVTLADGTRVWLNAASSLRFPAVFTGSRREVEVKGEAYFEVAHDAARPFVVKNGSLMVKVLGTHFNINAYQEEKDIKITLLEGKVNVTPAGRGSGVNISPGQQAQVPAAGDNIQVVSGIDPELVMAWKSNLFYFNNTDLRTIMQQIGRWYDIEVEYEGTVPQRKFSGKISRNTKASGVLSILEQSNVRFRMENKKIIVMP